MHNSEINYSLERKGFTLMSPDVSLHKKASVYGISDPEIIPEKRTF